MSRFAALDLGTNSTRFLCLESEDDGIQPETIVARNTRITRLGEGVDSNGKIQDGAIERVLEAVRAYDETVRDAEGSWIGGIATSACRRASDQSVESLFEQLEAAIGIRPEVIDGEREAVLTYEGVRASLPVEEGTIVDIGGGSTEWIPFDETGLRSARSFNMGVVTLNERCLEGDRYTQEAVGCMEGEIRRRWPEDLQGPSPLVTVGGTGTTLASMKQNLDEYDPERVHGRRLNRGEIRDFRRDMSARTFEELSEHPMIQAGREDVILPGVLILEAALKKVEGLETIVSDLGVLTGYLSEWIRS